MNQYVIALDVGGTKIKAGIFDKHLLMLEFMEVATDSSCHYTDFVQIIQDIILELCSKKSVSVQMVSNIAIGVPGFVTNEGKVLHLPNIGIKNFYLAEDLQHKLNIKVLVDNDANYAALGEWNYLKSKKQVNTELLAFVTIGTGIGCGMIIAGEIFRGANGFAGELGHFPLGDNYSKICGCGNKGCLETEVSVRGLATSYQANLRSEDYDFIVRKMLTEMDDRVVNILSEKAILLARELVKLACVIDPEYIVIGGGIGQYSGANFIEGIADSFSQLAPPLICERTNIVQAELGNKAGIYGAAVAAWRG